MKRFDLKGLDQAINTQYTDYKGIIAMDTHDGSNLVELAKKCNINVNQYFVYGVSCYDFEPIGQRDLSVKFLLIDKNIYGDTYDEISNFTGQIQIVHIDSTIPYSEVSKTLKRLSIGIVSDLSARINAQMPEDL